MTSMFADCVQKESGLHMAVLNMRVGQIAQVTMSPKYGYGEKGSFSFPSVKPNAHVEYEVELLGVSPPQEKERKNMFFEERLEAAIRMRARVRRRTRCMKRLKGSGCMNQYCHGPQSEAEEM